MQNLPLLARQTIRSAGSPLRASNILLRKIRYLSSYWDDHNFLVMELMGPSLKELLFLKQTKIAVNAPMKFQMKTVLLLAEQMISAVEFIHSKGIVHRDLKPANFCVGLGAMKNQVFLLDFGLAKRYIVNGKHIPEGKISGMIGNRTYASIGCHRLC